MARQLRLTDVKVKALPAKAKRYVVPDPECPGLYVRVMPTGAKSFTIVARDPYGKQKWREVDGATVGVELLEDVRTKARAGIKRIKAGQEAFPPPPPKPDAFKAVAENYIKRHVEKNGLRSQAEIERCLKRYVYPVWEKRIFAEINKTDINELLDKVEDENGARQADYVLAIVRGIMTWHESRTHGYSAPITRRMARTKPKERTRKRILAGDGSPETEARDGELRLIWPIVDTCNGFGALTKLLLLTAQRREKVAAMKWADVSVDGVWKIPVEPREKGCGGTLALPAAAIEIIRAQTRAEGNEYVFPGRGEGHFNGFSPCKRALDEKITAKLREADSKAKPLERWTMHDLRRTAKSLMARAQVPRFHSERVLGHTLDGVEGTYDQHSYFAEKRDALAKLAATVERILNPPAGNVTELRRA
jgi:integrase